MGSPFSGFAQFSPEPIFSSGTNSLAAIPLLEFRGMAATCSPVINSISVQAGLGTSTIMWSFGLSRGSAAGSTPRVGSGYFSGASEDFVGVNDVKLGPVAIYDRWLTAPAAPTVFLRRLSFNAQQTRPGTQINMVFRFIRGLRLLATDTLLLWSLTNGNGVPMGMLLPSVEFDA